MPTARSTPNIAFIKYWGNRFDALRIPMADSVSMTLDAPTVEIDLDHAEVLGVQSFASDGSERSLKEKDIARFQKHLDFTKRYLEHLGVPNAIPASVTITIRSAIPPAIGLASSAAVFSCLARAYQGLISPTIALTDKQTSIIARLGSGSAARSIFGGFTALIAGEGDAIDSAYGEQCAQEKHWPLHDIVVVPSMEEKTVGSTEGHATAHTSPFYPARITAITTRRQQACVDAVLTRDFEKLQAVAEEDSLDMHHVMETSDPPLQYLSGETHRIIHEVESLRRQRHLPVLYTMDAGPTVHLVCTEEAAGAIRDFAHAQKDCQVFETKVGGGAHLV
ncbi:diphosphomevalonate decarboxylase [Candidatus Peregrinibacteria bacterium CG10_big_fil_rev_8_21_14_0_10_55_24]|nr:MAG: diphosphomevalonate decarboxylase [Candidatus Peregrinibacteria bacterium CG10_big_fil_rev_8_21_14_0_10_55_24]